MILQVRGENDIVLFSRTFVKYELLPVFLISNVTGKNIELFYNFLNLLPAKNELNYSSNADK